MGGIVNVRPKPIFIYFLFFLLLPFSAKLKAQSFATFFVSVNGSDTLGDGTRLRPFRTPEKALMAANQALKSSNVQIRFLSDLYLSQPILIHPDNFQSHLHKGHTLEFLGESDNQQSKTTLSGGQIFTNPVPVSEGKTWRFFVGKNKHFRQVYVNGRRAVRARTDPGQHLGISSACDQNKSPESCWRGFLVCHDPKNASDCKKSPLASILSWPHHEEIEIVMRYQWMMPRCRFGSYVPQPNSPFAILTPIAQSPTIVKDGLFCWDLVTDSDSGTRKVPHVLWLENSMQFLDQEDEWYYDSRKGFVYFKPRRGKDALQHSSLVIPHLDYLVKIQGRPESPIKNISFRNLSFAHAKGIITGDEINTPKEQRWVDGAYGFPERQSGIMPNGFYPQGAVLVNYAEKINFLNNVFFQLGGGGLELTRGVQEAEIARNIFHDISSVGIRIGHTRKDAFHPSHPVEVNKIISVRSNLVTNIGVEYWGAVGIFAAYTDSVNISYNTLKDLPYTGISVGYGWGTPDFDKNGVPTPTPAQNNLIRGNLVENHVTKMNDGGGVYTLGNQPGTLIEQNVVRNQKGEYGAIYLDICSAGITVRNNLVYGNTRTFLIKGFNNQVYDNFWEVKRPEDLYVIKDPDGARCLSYSSYDELPNQFSAQNNRPIEEEDIENNLTIKDILNQAGLSPAHKSILTPRAPFWLTGQCSKTGFALNWEGVQAAQNYFIRVDDVSNNTANAWYFPLNSGDQIINSQSGTHLFIAAPKSQYRVWIHAANTIGLSRPTLIHLNCQNP